MNKEESYSLKKDIFLTKIQNIEELCLVNWYAINALVGSILSYSYKHPIAKESLKIMWEYRHIIMEENYYLNILKQNFRSINKEQWDIFLNMLDEVNEETLKYYYNCIDSIEDANITKQEYRSHRPIKSFKTIVETDIYREYLCGLLLTEKEVDSYLNYPEAFTTYIKSRILYVKGIEWYGVYPQIQNNKVVNIKVLVPNVVDIKTAMIYVHEMTHAYDMYTLLESEYVEKNYEEKAKESEKVFKESYFKQKVLTLFTSR